MKKFLSFLFCLLLVNSFSQDYWQQRDSVNGPSKAVCGSFVLMGEGYVLGGLDDFGFKRKMYSYNMFADDWDDEVSIGGPNGDGLERGSASTFSIGTKGYVCLGQGETDPYKNDLWEFDLATESWSQKADFIGTPRKQAVSFVINDIAYVGTGQDASGVQKDFYKYDPSSNSWTQLNDFPGTGRRQAVAFEMGGYGWMGTGDDGVLKKDFWMYTPSTDNWIQKANFPGTARAGAVGWSTFPTAFIATGEDVNFEYKKDVWEYNYYANAWIQRTDFPGNGRKNAIAFVINNVAFVGTGYSGVFEDDFFAYFGIAGVSETKTNFKSEIFPNPSSDKASIVFDSPELINASVRIFNNIGQEINTEKCVKKTLNRYDIDLNSFEPGIYHYKLSSISSNSFSSGKFIVQ